MLKFTVLSKQYSERYEWSYESHSPAIRDTLFLGKPQIGMLRYRL